jgi:hypothetical protein
MGQKAHPLGHDVSVVSSTGGVVQGYVVTVLFGGAGLILQRHPVWFDNSSSMRTRGARLYLMALCAVIVLLGVLGLVLAYALPHHH